MAKRQSSKSLKQRATDLRKIAAQSKTKVGRHLATRMADEKDRQAVEAKNQEDLRATSKSGET